MLEGLVAWVLNNYLGKYVENLNTDQLSIALLSGEVELENLPIRKDALRLLGLPLQVRAGYIGRVRLQIPVRQFRSAPWVILIEQLNVVAGPINLDEWDDEFERNATLERKLNKLDAHESRWRAQRDSDSGSGRQGSTSSTGYYASSYSSWLSYGASFVSGIVDNLQFKIRDIHIRYEDNISIPGQVFACGITLTSLNTNGTGNESSTSIILNGNSFNNGTSSGNISGNATGSKTMELQSLAFYWDSIEESDMLGNKSLGELAISLDAIKSHQYILKPVRGKAQLGRETPNGEFYMSNEKPCTKPRLVCDLQLHKVPLVLVDWQYEQVIKCVHGLENVAKIRKNRLNNRPCVTIKENAKAWWLYALKCNGHDFYHPTWEDCLVMARDNIKYVELYTKLLIAPSCTLNSDQKFLKDRMETILSLDKIKALREVSMSRVHEKSEQSNNEGGNGYGVLFQWFPQYWGWYGSSTTSKMSPANNENAVITSPSPENALDTELLNAFAHVQDDKQNCHVVAQFNFTLEEGTFSICMSESFSKSVPMLELHFETVKVSVETRSRNGSYQANLALGSVSILDKITKNTIFPVLVCPQGKENAPLPRMRQTTQRTQRISVTQQPYINLEKTNEPLFSLCFEKKPLGQNSDYSLNIKSQALDIVYNKSAMQWLIDFICKPHQMAAARRKINDMKLRTKQELIKNWEHLLDGDLSERKVWLLELDISAPQIIFVENFLDCDACVAVLDFGRLVLSNKHDESDKNLDEPGHYSRDSEDEDMFMTPCSTPPGSEASGSDSPTLCSNADVLKSHSENLILNQNTLHDRIYDKYNVEFLDLQVLVGRATDNWSFAHTKSTSPLHILDRFNISLQIERRLVHTVDPQYPSLIVSGTLPRLVMHIAEQKIFSLKKLLDILESGKTDSPFKSPTTVNSVIMENSMPSLDASKESGSKIVTLQFSVEQLAIEVQSRGKSVAELQVTGVRLGFTKCSTETSATLLVHGLLLVDALQTFGPDFELLVASHKHVGMDSVSGSLWDSDPCSPTSPASPDPMNIARRSTSPHQLSQALSSLRQGHISPVMETILNKSDTEALIVIEVLYVNASETEEAIQVASIQFNNLDIIANQETIVELIGFANRVLPKFQSTGSTLKSFKSADTKESLASNTRTEITFDFHRLNVLVLRALLRDGCYIGRKVATATMSEARIHATVGCGVTIEGSLGGLQVLDLTPAGITHQRVLSVGKDPLTDPVIVPHVDLLQMLTTEIYNTHQPLSEASCKEALSFHIKQNEIEEEKITNLEIKLRMGSVWYTYSPHLLHEIKMCVTEFQTYLSALAHSIRAKATDMAFNLVQARMDSLSYEAYPISGQKKLHNTECNVTINLDIVLETPVLVLPRASTSPHVFVAHLGRISLTNSHNSTNEVVPKKIYNAAFDTYTIEVRDMNLYSLDTSDRRKVVDHGTILKAEELYSSENGLPILHDTTIRLEIVRELPDLHNSMELLEDKMIRDCINVNGCVVTPLRVSLSREQYEQLLDTIDNLISSPEDFPNSKSEDETDSETLSQAKNIQKNILDAKVKFEMPCLTLELRGDCGTGQQGLVEVSLRDFIFNYEKCHDYETSILVSLRTLIMEDLLKEPDSKYRYMMVSSTSKQTWQPGWFVSHSCPNFIKTAGGYLDDGPSGSLPNHLEPRHRTGRNPSLQIDPYPITPPSSPKFKDSHMLVKVSALLVDDRAPEFTTKYRSLHKCISIDFNSLDTVVAVQSWLVVLDFFGMSDTKSYQEESNQELASVSNANSEVEIFVRSLNMVMIRRDEDLAKVSISNVSFTITKDSSVKLITGTLGSLLVMDLTPQGCMYREKFTTCGEEALNFTYLCNLNNKNLKGNMKDNFLGNEANLKIEMASVRYVHTKRFVTELQNFFNHLSLMQNIMEKVRQRTKHKNNKASINQEAKLIDKHSFRLLLDVQISKPVIVLPAGSMSYRYVVADADALTITNSFRIAVPSSETLETGELVDSVNIQLVEADLYEGSQGSPVIDGNLGTKLKQGSSLLAGKRTVNILVERRLNPSNVCSVLPNLMIQCTLSKLDASLDLDQYGLVRGVLKHNLGENLDDLFNPEVNVMDEEKIFDEEKDENHYLPIRTISCLRILLHDVTVDLNLKQSEPLARVNFIKSRLTVDSYSDDTQDIDLVSQEILVIDTRYKDEPVNKRGNMFSNILQPIRFHHDTNQVQLELHSRIRNSNSKYTILLNNMRLMAIWDWLEIAKNYLNQCHGDTADHSVKQGNVARNTIGGKNLYKSLKLNDETNRKTTLLKNHSAKEDTNAVFEMKLNITDSELVVVENASLWDTNAVILKSTSVVSYRPGSQKPLSLNLNRLELFSCVLGAEEDSALSIIDPVTIQIDLGQDGLLEAQLHTLCIRLSYHDVLMFRRIFSSLPQQFKSDSNSVRNKPSPPANTKSQISKLSALGFSKSECAKALEQCDYLLDDAALLLTARSPGNFRSSQSSNEDIDKKDENAKSFEIAALEIKSDCVSLCIIDDCKDSDVPLLEFSLSELFFKHDLKGEHNHEKANELTNGMPKPILPPPVEDVDMSSALVHVENRTLGHFGTHLSAMLAGDYYNRALSGWEPFIEPWKCDIRIQFNEATKTGLANDELVLRIFSSEMLNMNVTSTLIDLYNMVHKNWSQDIYSEVHDAGQVSTPVGFKRRYPFIPFALKNETGNNLWFYTLVTSPDSHLTKSIPPPTDPGWCLVCPGDTTPLSFAQTAFSLGGVSLRQRGGARHNEPTLHQTFARVQGWTPVGPVSVDKVGVYFRHAHAEYETMNLEMPRARIVFSVTLEGSAQKLVTVRSALRVVNNIDCPIQLSMEYYNGQFGILNWPPTKEALVQPGTVFSVPLTHAHSHIKLRPIVLNGNLKKSSRYEQGSKMNEMEKESQGLRYGAANFRNKLHDFQLCKQPIMWWRIQRSGEVMQELRTCYDKDKVYRLVACIRRDNYPNTTSMTTTSAGNLTTAIVQPAHTISIAPVALLCNRLPCDLIYRLVTPNSGVISGSIKNAESKGRVRPEARSALTEVDLEKATEIQITLDGFPSSGSIQLPGGSLTGIGTGTLTTATSTGFQNTAITTQRIRLLDHDYRPLHLEASVTVAKNGGLQVTVWCPFWVVNRAGLPVVVAQEGAGREAAGQGVEHEAGRMAAPLLFSLADQDAAPALVMRRGGRGCQDGGVPQWCQPLHLQPGVQVRRLVTTQRDGRPDAVALVGVEVRRRLAASGDPSDRTTVVTVTPRHRVRNRSSSRVELSQKCFATTVSDPGAAATHQHAPPGSEQAFHWPRPDKDQLLCLRLPDVQDCLWSAGLRVDRTHSLHVNIRDSSGGMHFVRVEVLLQGATYFIVIGDAQELPPPIRIDNYSQVPITFYQSGYGEQWRSVARPGTAVAYAPDEPPASANASSGSSALICLASPGGQRAIYDVNELGPAGGLAYENFIYIAFTGTFDGEDDPPLNFAISHESSLTLNGIPDVTRQQLVLTATPSSGGRLVLARKQAGDRSQLWRMTSSGQLQHEGSSPPRDLDGGLADAGSNSQRGYSEKILVLDIEGPAPRPARYERLALRRPDPRRRSTQTWKFAADGRLVCAHNGVCVQAKDGLFGLRPGGEAVLGLQQHRDGASNTDVPLDQAVGRQRMRPGSGFLSVTIVTDGPTRVLQIHDVKIPGSYPLPCEWRSSSAQVSILPNGSGETTSKTKDISLSVRLDGGLGVSLVTRPCSTSAHISSKECDDQAELLYASLNTIAMEARFGKTVRRMDLKVGDIQIDNQLLDAPCPVLLHSRTSSDRKIAMPAIHVCCEVLPSPNLNAVIFKHLIIQLRPLSVFLEERLLLRLALFVGLYPPQNQNSLTSRRTNSEIERSASFDFEDRSPALATSTSNAKRYYFGILQIVPGQIRLSMMTSSKLPPQLQAVKRHLGLTLIKFEDAAIELEAFSRRHPFETSESLVQSIIKHYKDELKWQAANILGSVDFLGNPLGFVNDVSEGVSGLFSEGNIAALVKNVTHGLSNSAAKVTESLSDGIGRVIMDEHHEEARRRIRGAVAPSGHLAAGLRGLGFGLLGGVTSIVKQTYEGAAAEGVQGLFSGLGKGLVGTVTKPIVGVLDLASETATAVRDSSRSSSRTLPERTRLPRCVSSGPGGLLPAYNPRHALGQEYLFALNERNFAEMFIGYESIRRGYEDLRVLISTERVRVFTGTPPERANVVIEVHLSDLVNCKYVKTMESDRNLHYIELKVTITTTHSLHGDIAVKRPRVRCDSESIALSVSRQINYAKSIFSERLQTLITSDVS